MVVPSAGGVGASRCDFCGAACAESGRQRLLWRDKAGDEFVLADLCARCASDAPRLLEVYGGRGRASMRVTQSAPAEGIRLLLVRRASGLLVRAAFYVLIALVTFFLVTLITSHGWNGRKTSTNGEVRLLADFVSTADR
jgi:hypothetical protein